MRVKQAVKHFTLLSMIAVGLSACSSTQDIEEQPTQAPVIVAEPVIEEIEEEVVSKVINNGVIDIPILDNAQVFAEFTDKLPAVINYFTQSSEAQVIDFYQQAFGEPYSQELKRDRLTLQYQEGKEIMRVVISQQNKKRQVDVIIENKN
ncbi:hypothetical protein [Colwellia sp. Bg11-28]|uniref:hypothetical protein n=1 Tax=Colwellia sp. Bg11-28 TaxID=2058305 RepID=UPI001E400C05|nr:hypothetical protein [Colwellia sp. Bg11-28]